MPVSKASYINFSGSYMNQQDCALEKEVGHKKDRGCWPVPVRHDEITIFLLFFNWLI